MNQQVYGKHYGSNVAENYDRFFVPHIGTPVMMTLIEHAAPAEGERVLDVACGTGVVTRTAAERVGKEARVAGLDITGGMLAVAKDVSGAQGIEWHEASAESMPLDDASFDLVLSQMGLQFISNKLAAMREMRRVLAPGGRLALNVPGPIPDLFTRLAAVLADRAGSEAADFCRIVFSLHDPDELRELAVSAGFREIDIRQQPVRLDVPDAADFLWGYIYSTPLAPSFAEEDESSLAELQHDVCEAWRPFAHGHGMRFEVGITTLLCR
ncbi:MAG TPA: methyltransferase domain-containing protein [Gammaproteobacteria bacterium]|nr:methyltransferase domain-containing protein [Gammaproteobacteria bacterium]